MRRFKQDFFASISALSAGVHLLLMLPLAAYGCWQMVAIQAMRCGFYIGLYYLARQSPRHISTLMFAALLEILLGTCLHLVLLGWDSGAHYALFSTLVLIAPLHSSQRLATWLTSAVALGYLALDYFFHTASPLYPLPESALWLLRACHILTVLACMSFCAQHYLKLRSRSDQRLRTLAHTDPLTGLDNRFALLERERFRRSQPSPRECVIIADIDHFKRFNDQYGHAVGDQVIQSAAQTLQRSFPRQAHLCRWGGEEFVILLPHCSIERALMQAETVRQTIERTPVYAKEHCLYLSMTFGVTEVKKSENLLDALDRADQALYRGKRQGRNQVVHEPRVAPRSLA